MKCTANSVTGASTTAGHGRASQRGCPNHVLAQTNFLPAVTEFDCEIAHVRAIERPTSHSDSRMNHPRVAEFSSFDLAAVYSDHLTASRAIRRPADDIERYVIERVLASSQLTADNFDVTTEPGHHGDEITGVYLNATSAAAIETDLRTILATASDSARIEALLTREYGHVLPALRDRTWTLTWTPTSRLHFGATEHQANLHEPTFRRYRRQLTVVNRNTPPLGVCADAGTRLRVVDGYHRLTAARDNRIEAVPVLVAGKP
jgi:hypothetical protein